jgi:hypothetical protein
LNFAEVKVEYAQQDDKGGKVGSNDYSWNIAQNATD